MINYVSRPVYDWSSYWLKWDEIIGYNTETKCVIVKNVNPEDIFKQGMREHCTTLEKSCLSTSIISRNEYKRYDEFRNEVKKTSEEALNILLKTGVPKRLINFKK
jgi:hypothetical protein